MPRRANISANIATTARLLFGVFPDLQSVEQNLIVDGDKVITQRILCETQRGEFMGIAPTGGGVSTGGIWLSPLSGGQIKEQWVYIDALGILQQIRVNL